MNFQLNYSLESRALYNPAYCGLLIIIFLYSYERHINKPCPAALIYLILPLTLNDEIIDYIYSHKRKNFFQIYEMNPQLLNKINYVIHNESYFNITNNTLYFLVNNNSIELNIKNKIVVNTKNIDLKKLKKVNIYLKIQTLAKILSNVNDIQSIYFTLGIKL